MSLGIDFWAPLVLGGGGGIAGLFSLFSKVADRKQDKTQRDGVIQLDKATRERIAAEAAKINDDSRIRTETWWKEQFDAVKIELKAEQDWRRGMTKRLGPHLAWDERVAGKIRELGEEVGEPPSLDPDEA